MQLLERLDRHATDTPDRLALREIASGRTLTYRQLSDATRTPTAGRVLQCGNNLDFHIAFLAALRANVLIFPISPTAIPREVDALHEATADLPENGAAVLLQSSGTTALPKIVRRDGASLDAVAAQMVNAINIKPTDTVFSCVPLCHSYGLEHGLLAPLWAGATVHLADGFDIDRVRRELSASAITIFPAVPSIYEMLANLHDSDVSFPNLRVAYSAGGPLPTSIFEKVRERCGVSVGQLYGATEIGSVTFSHPADARFNSASVGQPMRGVELKLDHDQQLLVRAASMTSGYVGDHSGLTADGFFPTGDVARLDDHGNLFITGRLKLLIDVGGLKVNPLEVEQMLSEHPQVAACVVVPIRLSETVSRLKAIVSPANSDDPPKLESLRDFARERLSSHKVPRVFEIRPTLPRSATGKILRHLLVEQA
jgi:acyl-CoA synthetase (AMP-forming)/AMP-acid ligase II